MISELLSSDNAYHRVLIAPLNWGLGHATRMIPVIRHCIELGKVVAIASDGVAYDLLKQEFPILQSYELPPYDITYSKHSTKLKIMSQAPKIALRANAEYKVTSNIVEDFKPDLIISDNRLGVRHSDVRSIVVTHQVNLISPLQMFNVPARKINIKMLNQFDEVWIMDYEDRRLSGKLSDPKGLDNYQYLGALTRLTRMEEVASDTLDILVILSGPEPQRRILEEKLLDILPELPYRYHVIRGSQSDLSEQYRALHKEGLISDLVVTDALNQLINDAKVVVTRTGYTSVMDLDALQQKAILIPTPGQSEQVYLGEHLRSHPLFEIVEQRNIEQELSGLLRDILT